MCLMQLHLVIQITYQVSTDDRLLKQSNPELDAWGFLQE